MLLIIITQKPLKINKISIKINKKYYNKKVFKGLNLKKGNKVYLFTKIFKSKQLSKKLNYIKIGLFKIISKGIKFIYRLDLPLKIKIYLIYYIAILKLAYKNYKLLVYK